VGSVPAANLGPFPPILVADWLVARLNGKPFNTERWFSSPLDGLSKPLCETCLTSNLTDCFSRGQRRNEYGTASALFGELQDIPGRIMKTLAHVCTTTAIPQNGKRLVSSS